MLWTSIVSRGLLVLLGALFHMHIQADIQAEYDHIWSIGSVEPVFLNSTDETFSAPKAVETLVLGGKEAGPPAVYMDDVNREVLDSTPDPEIQTIAFPEIESDPSSLDSAPGVSDSIPGHPFPFATATAGVVFAIIVIRVSRDRAGHRLSKHTGRARWNTHEPFFLVIPIRTHEESAHGIPDASNWFQRMLKCVNTASTSSAACVPVKRGRSPSSPPAAQKSKGEWWVNPRIAERWAPGAESSGSAIDDIYSLVVKPTSLIPESALSSKCVDFACGADIAPKDANVTSQASSLAPRSLKGDGELDDDDLDSNGMKSNSNTVVPISQEADNPVAASPSLPYLAPLLSSPNLDPFRYEPTSSARVPFSTSMAGNSNSSLQSMTTFVSDSNRTPPLAGDNSSCALSVSEGQHEDIYTPGTIIYQTSASVRRKQSPATMSYSPKNAPFGVPRGVPELPKAVLFATVHASPPTGPVKVQRTSHTGSPEQHTQPSTSWSFPEDDKTLPVSSSPRSKDVGAVTAFPEFFPPTCEFVPPPILERPSFCPPGSELIPSSEVLLPEAFVFPSTVPECVWHVEGPPILVDAPAVVNDPSRPVRPIPSKPPSLCAATSASTAQLATTQKSGFNDDQHPQSSSAPGKISSQNGDGTLANAQVSSSPLQEHHTAIPVKMRGEFRAQGVRAISGNVFCGKLNVSEVNDDGGRVAEDAVNTSATHA